RSALRAFPSVTMPDITRQMLRDYLNDALPEKETALIERALRESAAVRRELQEGLEEVDRGGHTAGAIWRRGRVRCPTREQLGGSLLGSIDAGLEDYIEFHLETIGCPYCQANLDDLKKLQGG